MMKKLLRLLRIAPLALVFAGVASAQTTGTIIGVVTDASTGKPVAGAVVIATSPTMQGEQTAVTDGNGNYRLTLLPPGEYKLAVQLEGYKPSDRSDIRLSLDKTLRANLAVVPESVVIEEQVVRTGAAPVVNVGSAESGSVISSEFVASIPVGRTFDTIARVAPTASSDTYGTGFAGAQSPENSYILDGLNVSDPSNGTNNANILSNFVQEIDVKTGNFSAEYGRATGGIMNVVTKSGSNEFHGSVFANFTPSFLIQPDGKVAGRAGEAIASISKPSEGNYDLDLGFEVGGPIVKDKLWFFAGFAPQTQKRYTERFLRANVLDGADGTTGNLVTDADGNIAWEKIGGTEKMYDNFLTTYQFAGKLTYLLDENNQLGVSAYLVPGSQSSLAMNSEETIRKFDNDFGSTNVGGRYSGKFLDKHLVVQALVGFSRNVDKDQPSSFQKNTPQTDWIAATRTTLQLSQFNVPDPDGTTAAYEPLNAAAQAVCGPTADPDRCYVNRYLTGGQGYFNDYTADRLSANVNASYLLEAFGSHNWKGGVDLERNTYDIKKGYGGGQLFRADTRFPGEANYNIRGYGRVLDASGNAALFGPEVEWLPIETSQSVTNSFSYYLQDSWTIANSGVTLNAGLRLETQSMEATNAGGIKGISINNMWSPRIQAVWDFTGTGRGKAAASWGRFYYSIPLDMGDRAFGGEEAADANWDCGAVTPANTPRDPEANAAAGGSCTLLEGYYGADDLGNPLTYINVGSITPVAPDLKGIYVDQFGAQVEYELLSDLSVGFDYQGRRQGTMIEDMSSDDGNSYFIANPGQSEPFGAVYFPGTTNQFTVDVNPKRVEALDQFSRRVVAVTMPKAERSYDGFTFKVTKNFSQSWLAQGSYTYSALRGNVAGVFDPSTGQLDPGINAEYDLATLMTNKTGYLPGDRPHTFKVFGAYNWKLSPKMNLTASGAFTANSGTPVNALGAHPIYGSGYAFVVQRGSAGDTPFVTKLDLGGRFEYTITPPYAIRFTVDVFNVLNNQEVLNIDQNYTFSQVQGIRNVKCDSSASGSSNPTAKLQADCADVAYLKTVTGAPVVNNPNFGKPVAATASYQAPLSLRLGLAVTF